MLSSWAEQYVSDVHTGPAVLDQDPAKLTPATFRELADELESYRFAETFPGDELAQLRWALFEERRRVVGTLIKKVIVARTPDGKDRTIMPSLALDVPLPSTSLISGDQAVESQARDDSDIALVA